MSMGSWEMPLANFKSLVPEMNYFDETLSHFAIWLLHNFSLYTISAFMQFWHPVYALAPPKNHCWGGHSLMAAPASMSLESLQNHYATLILCLGFEP